MAILAMDDEHPGAAMFSVGEMRSFADLLTAAADGIEGEAGR
jgi:hypothetical protein